MDVAVSRVLIVIAPALDVQMGKNRIKDNFISRDPYGIGSGEVNSSKDRMIKMISAYS